MYHPQARRTFLGHSSIGVGAAALASMLGRESAQARIEGGAAEGIAAFPAADQTRHLSLHGRWSVPSGDIRLQAGSREDGRPAHAAVVHRGAADCAAAGAGAEGSWATEEVSRLW